MSVIGFDIGNENCVIAAAKRSGIDVLLNDEAKGESPAVVSFGDKQRFFGSVGATVATMNPKSTISQIKRLIGRQYKELQEELKLLPFVTSEGPRGGILIELEYMKMKMTFTPVEIMGMLFKHLKQIAEKNLKSSVGKCVIGIPSYFTDLQRHEYLDAATIAGLEPYKLMHDGTATALGYGMYKTNFPDKGKTNIVFVDIGHCDTQVTLAAFDQGKMKIVSHTFDPNLGGRDFDELLFKHFAAQFKEQFKIDVHSNARASIRLRASCEKLKRVLSVNTEAPLSIECLIEDTDVTGIMTRVEFEKLSRELLKRVTIPCRKAVRDSGICVDEIYSVELVGSGSRIPAIMKELALFFKKEPTRTLNASECVARGCALLCAMNSPTLQVQPYEVQDFFPYSIGFRSQNKAGHENILFPKGSPFPANFRTSYRATMPLHVQVFYTNNKDFPAIKSDRVGNFRIGPRQSSGKKEVRTEFEVRLNIHGIVVIESAIILEDENGSYYWQKKNVNSRIDLQFSENLDYTEAKVELHQAQKREVDLEKQDKKMEEVTIQRNTLESFVYGSRSKLSNAYRNFATDTEKDGIMKSLQKTEDWLSNQDSDDESLEPYYTVKLKDLKKLLDPIEKRYEDDIAKAKGTKDMTDLIEKYRSDTDSMLHWQKDLINNKCLEAEQWLIGFQQGESFKNIDAIHSSSIIQEAMKIFNSNVEGVLKLKSLSPKNEPVGTDQSDQCMEQSDQLSDGLIEELPDAPKSSQESGDNVPEDVEGILKSKTLSPKYEPVDPDQRDQCMHQSDLPGALIEKIQDAPQSSQESGENVPVNEKVKQVYVTRSGNTHGVAGKLKGGVSSSSLAKSSSARYDGGSKMYTQDEVNDLIKKEGKRLASSYNMKLEDLRTEFARKGISLDISFLVSEEDEEYKESNDE